MPLLHLAVALTALVAIAEDLIAHGPISGIYVPYLFPALGALYIATGLFAWGRRPNNRLGSLMTATGAAIVVSSLSNTAQPLLFAAGAITATLPLSIVIHLVHACPSGVVRGAPARVTVGAAYFAGLLLQAPLWAFSPTPAPFDVLVVSPRPDLVTIGGDVQKCFGAVVVVATVWLLVRRLRDYDAADRRLLAVQLIVAVFAVLTVPLGADVLLPLGMGPEGVADIQLAAVALVPLGFLWLLLRGGFTPLGEISVFAASVASSAGVGEDVRELDLAIATALGDPSAELLRWAGDAYIDAEGRLRQAPGTAPYRSTMHISGAGGPLGAIVHDTALDTDPATLAAVTHVVGIALEREELAREVSDSRVALQDASRRLLLAGDAERRRVARDLHDGLQGSLVLLSLQARELTSQPADAQAVSARRLADGLDSAARTLRGLVDGVLPPPLVERGLLAAVRELAEDLPIAAEIQMEGLDERLPVPVENTAYFVIAEAVTNVIKHAGASRVRIAAVLEGTELVLDVEDDGVGGAQEATGHGLSGLHDRLAILGGSLNILDASVGTKIVARLPCG